ncbi:MAG: hypothetical protein CMLOHMNK_00006 [Steroidobacteraceae bacterium]|nr:hypothetical protein [Steroidobacteraceae bacterium]
MNTLAQGGLPAARQMWPAAGVALIVSGLVLLGWLGWRLVQPVASPYHYRLATEGRAADYPELRLGGHDALKVRKFEVRAGGVDAPLAIVHLAESPGTAPVLLGWRNRGAEPVLAFDTEPKDVRALADAVAQHAPSPARLLAWWDTSRQLRLLVEANVLYDENMARPLLLPEAWRGARSVIERQETRFWGAVSAGAPVTRFDRFVDALASEVPVALDTLRALAGAGDAYIVLRLDDAYRVGLLRPGRFGVGYRDFPNNVQLHGAIVGVKAWLKEQGYESYAVEARGENALRVYFLTDAAAQKTMIAQLLPFSSSNPFTLAAPQVVYQQGPYWVYKLPPSR